MPSFFRRPKRVLPDEGSGTSDRTRRDSEAQQEAENDVRRESSQRAARSQALENEARRQASDGAARSQALENEARRLASDEASRRQSAENAARHRTPGPEPRG